MIFIAYYSIESMIKYPKLAMFKTMFNIKREPNVCKICHLRNHVGTCGRC